MSEIKDTPISIKLKILRDADFILDDMSEKYIILTDFVKSCLSHTCCLCNSECCIPCNAKQLLEEIGELNV